MKIGDSVTIAFNKVPDDELDRLETLTKANVMRKNPAAGEKFKLSRRHEQTEAETGLIVGELEYLNDDEEIKSLFRVRVNKKNGGTALREIDESLLTVT